MAAVLRWLRSDLPLQSPSYPLRKTAERQEQARIVEFPLYLPRTSRDMSPIATRILDKDWGKLTEREEKAVEAFSK